MLLYEKKCLYLYKYISIMATKVATTLSIDEEVKKQFKMECLINENDMSTVIEEFMKSYTRMSKEMNSNKED